MTLGAAPEAGDNDEPFEETVFVRQYATVGGVSGASMPHALLTVASYAALVEAIKMCRPLESPKLFKVYYAEPNVGIRSVNSQRTFGKYISCRETGKLAPRDLPLLVHKARSDANTSPVKTHELLINIPSIRLTSTPSSQMNSPEPGTPVAAAGAKRADQQEALFFRVAGDKESLFFGWESDVTVKEGIVLQKHLDDFDAVSLYSDESALKENFTKSGSAADKDKQWKSVVKADRLCAVPQATLIEEAKKRGFVIVQDLEPSLKTHWGIGEASPQGRQLDEFEWSLANLAVFFRPISSTLPDPKK